VLYIHWVDETNDNVLCNGSEEDGNVRSKCGEGEGTDCENQTVTLIGKAR
jgi:hypothetical protein